MKKNFRILALILALALCFTCMAVSVFAGDEGAGTGTTPGSSSSSSSSTSTPSSSAAPAPASAPVEHETKFVPDVSGHFRTSASKITEKVTPAAAAQQNLYVDPVTNTITNLYDADGNLIPATLSSDGHFYIIPSNDGYVYIPVA